LRTKKQPSEYGDREELRPDRLEACAAVKDPLRREPVISGRDTLILLDLVEEPFDLLARDTDTAKANRPWRLRLANVSHASR
jgi:hypothetical protein